MDLEKIRRDLLKEKKVVVICGPTGIGKTRLGVEIAGLLKTDMISADSMQLYRGMDIGTDKMVRPVKGVKQYMIDTHEPDHRVTVMEYRDSAARVIKQNFFERNRVPIVVGGSGMYVKGLIDGIDRGPGEDRKLRNSLEQGIRTNGLQKYFDRLSRIDPDYAETISKNDRRRIIRALEVYILTGKPFYEFQRSWSGDPAFDALFIGLKKERRSLYLDIENRVDRMFEKGLVEEVSRLLEKGYGSAGSLMQGVGYKETLGYLRGEMELEQCRRKIKQNSRRLAKKQMTWFRKDPRINWLRVDNYDNIFDLVQDTLKLIYRETYGKKDRVFKI